MTSYPAAKAYKIDSAAQTITEIEITCLEDIQAAVGGNIELFAILSGSDTLYVDEEGLFKKGLQSFALLSFALIPKNSGRPRQAMGNGILVGMELLDKNENLLGMAAPRTSIELLKAMILFD